jgi:hypothetical protein
MGWIKGKIEPKMTKLKWDSNILRELVGCT